ncbi:transposase [Synechococcus sp. ROS8604]|uniref:transposase n=1 Tax=Synechococcus sp. ROS8604 TaxID=1442557 RepID=UPI00185FFAAA|nr:transposase [Synechococcus sp. ROS8604]QNI89521.1 transposase [Synechococcus sp. ROS8604]
MKAKKKTLQRQIRCQFQGKRHIPVQACVFEESHGRVINWIVEVIAVGTRDGKTLRQTHFFLTSLRTTPEAMLQLVRDRWSIESWHWIRDTQLDEDAHRYRSNGAGAMATLRTAALNLLRLGGFQSIRAGMQAVTHDIAALLAMATRKPEPSPS